jgi:uncharacterized membrane protein
MNNKRVVRTYSSPFEWDFLENSGDFFLVCIPIVLLLLIAIPFAFSGYWEDEIFSITTARSWRDMFFVFRNYENNMSLYYVFLHGWMKIFGESEIAIHSLSLLFAVLAIPVFYKLERIWLNKSSSVVGALLLAANPLFTYYAVEARSYSMLILAATLSTLLFVRLVRKPGYLLAFFYGLSVAAAAYIHYFGLLLIPVHGLSIIWKRFSRLQFKTFFLSGLVIAAGILPLVLFPPKNKTQIDWIKMPDFHLLWFTVKDLFGGGAAFVILMICLVFGIKGGFRKQAAEEGNIMPKLSVAWAFVPVILLFVFSHLVKPAFLIRFFVWCLPGSILFTCLIIGNTGWNHIRKSIIWLGLITILVVRSYSVLHVKGSGYKDAVRYLNENIRPGETVLAYPYYKSVHTVYYLDKLPFAKPNARPFIITSESFLPGGGGKDPSPDFDMLKKFAAGKGRIYLICKEAEIPTITDTIQNRTYLPEIESIIAGTHPVKENRIFGAGLEEPIRIIVYE